MTAQLTPLVHAADSLDQAEKLLSALHLAIKGAGEGDDETEDLCTLAVVIIEKINIARPVVSAELKRQREALGRAQRKAA